MQTRLSSHNPFNMTIFRSVLQSMTGDLAGEMTRGGLDAASRHGSPGLGGCGLNA